jgi:5-carboxymethyl-2-hydroxymuconate isomerase
MPHLTVEYTRNLSGIDMPALLLKLNQALAACGQFEEERDIKSRGLALDHFLVGSSADPRGFVHAKLAILSGRTEVVKRQLSEQLLDVLKAHVPCPHFMDLQLCVEIQEISRAVYAKAVVSGVPTL